MINLTVPQLKITLKALGREIGVLEDKVYAAAHHGCYQQRARLDEQLDAAEKAWDEINKLVKAAA